MNDYQLTLITADGRIICLRCMAISKRTRLQCGRPAMKGSKTQKCNFHGGKSTGPKTTVGLQRISKANLVHGDETVQRRAERQIKAVWFKQVEDVMHVLDITTGGRARGPKPNGYKPIKSIEEIRKWVLLRPV
jgi:hypothetical protein